MTCDMKLTPELIEAFFDIETAKKCSAFSEADLSFISWQNPNSDYSHFNKQFLSNLLAEAESFNLDVRCKLYCSGNIKLNICNGDFDYNHMPGSLCIVLNSKSMLFVNSLTINDFKICNDGHMSGDYVVDYYKQFPKTALKKVGWNCLRECGGIRYASEIMPDFKLAWFKDWISETARIRDSIEKAVRCIEKQKRILELNFDTFSGHAEQIAALAEEKLPGVKCVLDAILPIKTYKLTLCNYNCVITISMDSRGLWNCETYSPIPKFKRLSAASPTEVVEWITKLFDAEMKHVAESKKTKRTNELINCL